MSTPRRDATPTSEVFGPIRTVNAFEQLIERIGRAIKLGLLRPGERLPAERRLAEQLELSRSTVREALRVLYEAGYLEARRGGVFVAQTLPTPPRADPAGILTDAAALHDLVAFRMCLELGAAELAAERASESDCDRLARLIDEADSHAGDGTYAAYRAADSRFHITLARISGSIRIADELTQLHATFTDLLLMIPHSDEVLANSTAQHRRVLGAITMHDAELARLAMREHLDGAERMLQGILPTV
jgi:DNA-binding FadR family transcriptional regulator